MTKPLKFTLISFSALFLVACTGEKQNKRTQMQEKELFFISHSYPEDVCMGQQLKDTLAKATGLKNIISSSTDNSINCAYFGRTSSTCVKFAFTEEYPNACAISADRSEDKKNKRMNAKDVADVMIGLLKK